jgi:hypothetical protein
MQPLSRSGRGFRVRATKSKLRNMLAKLIAALMKTVINSFIKNKNLARPLSIFKKPGTHIDKECWSSLRNLD